MYEDKILKCRDCGQEFTFTAGEQEFYAERGFNNAPSRCKACRDAKKSAAKPARNLFSAVCAGCGKEALVPNIKNFVKSISLSDKKIIITPIDGLI